MKNKKNKIFKIVLASMMIFSGCFVSVHAEETTTKPLNNTYFDNPLLAVKEDKVIDNNGYNGKQKPEFKASEDLEGSDLSEGATEGMVWTNKIVEKISTDSEPGKYKITLQARGFKYREVNSENKKTNTWLNPLAKDSEFSFKEEISPDFTLIGGPSVSDSSIGVNRFAYVNEDKTEVGINFNANDVSIDSSKEGIAFDLDVSFTVRVNKNAKANIAYETKEAVSKFTPDKDNYYYYEWGWTRSNYSMNGLNWNADGTWKGINEVFVTLPVGPNPADGTFTLEIGKQGNNDIVTGEFEELFTKTGEELAKIESKPAIAKNIEKIDFKIERQSEGRFLFKYIIYFTNKTVLTLEPEADVKAGGGNSDKSIELGEVITKDDPIERENAGLVNGKKVEEFDNHGYIRLIENDISTIIDVDKTAVNKNWNERTYDVTINASSKLKKTEEKPVDIVLAFDVSGSMLFPSKLNKINNINYESFKNLKDKLFSFNGDFKNNTNKVYYTIEGPTAHAKVCRIFYEERNGWMIIDSSLNNDDVDKNGNRRAVTLEKYSEQDAVKNQNSWFIYEDDSYEGRKRFYYTKNAAIQFISSFKEVSKESRIAFVPFSQDVINDKVVTFSQGQNINWNQHINSLTTSGGTDQIDGINKASEMFENNGREKFIILLTDGSLSAKDEKNSKIKKTNEQLIEAAEKIRKNCTLITLGVSLGDVQTAKDVLSKISSKTISGNKFLYELSYNSEYPAELDSMFNSIISSVMGSSLTEVVVKDYIDPRFDLMNGNVLAKKGDEINGGRVGEDEKGMYIEWTNVTVGNELSGAPGWSKTITLKAKEDFLGGNIITTNGDAYVKVPVDSNGDGKLDANDEWHNVNLPKPTVNVKELTGTTVEKEKTFFLGEDILPEEMINLIKDNIKVDDSIVKILDEILKSGNTTIRYKYPGTGDELGTIKLELTKAFDEKHVAKKVGNHVEEYRLKLTYIPDTYKKRNEDMDNIYVRPIKPSPVCDQFDMVDGTSWVNVIAGQIRVTKHIDQSTSNAGQGDPIFTFRITNTETKESYEKFVRFKDGQTEDLTVVFDNLSKGNWVVEELPTMRYKLDSVVATGDSVSVKDKVAYVNLGRNKENFNKSGFVTFNNELVVEDNLSDTNIVKNTFTVEENGKVTINKISTSENN